MQAVVLLNMLRRPHYYSHFMQDFVLWVLKALNVY